jgi:signal transduction histidine kinase
LPEEQVDLKEPEEERIATSLAEARCTIERALSNQPSASERINRIVAPILREMTKAESALGGPASIETPMSADPYACIRQRVAELEEALRARDEFIATIGHELKNPVTPVLLQVRQLQSTVLDAGSGHVPADALLPRVESMLSRLRRFLGTLNRILDVSRINSGRIDLQIEDIDLAEVVRSVAADMEREIAASTSSLTVRANGQVIGRWDRLRLEQICSNLLSNAVRYGLGNPIEVDVSAREGAAVLTVKDQGTGIPEDDLQIIFERFERGARSRHSGGFGVGLWVVKRLCRALGGDVEVQSQVGQGSTFTVALPREERTKE